jgi:hypothetical protein
MALFNKKKKSKEEPPKFYKDLRDKVDRVFMSSEYTTRRENMNRWLKEYNGEWWSQEILQKQDPKASQIYVNLVFSDVQTNAPLLTDNRPKWFVRAKVDFLQDYINVYAKCLDYLWDKEELDHKTYLAVKDSMIFPLGLMKVYFDPDKEDYGDLCFDVVDPRTFVCAPGYDDLWKVPWCGEIVRKPMTWIKESYPDKYDEIKSDARDDSLSDAETWDESTLEGEVVTVYEIWMRDNEIEEYLEETEGDEEGDKKEKKKRPKYPYGRIVTLTKDKVLADRPSPFQHNKPYYVPFYDYEGVHDIWGMPEAAQIENLNREINSRLQALVWAADKHARINYTADTNAGIDIEQVKAELSKGDNVWAVNHTINDQPIKPIEQPPINPIHLKLVDMLMAMIEEVSGVTDISKGMAVKKQRQTASEVSVLIESSYTRTRQRVRNLEWSVKRLTYLSISLMQQFYDEPRDFNFREDNDLNFGTISNSPNMLAQTVKPAEGENEDEAYKRALEYIEKHPDRIYADFEIEIQTNSTLPMDRQSLANLALRLFEMKAIDREALFEFLSLPMGKEIAGRMQQQEMAMMAAKAGPAPGAPPAGMPLPMRPAQQGPQIVRQGAPNAATR